jgi:hypothetical protein
MVADFNYKAEAEEVTGLVYENRFDKMVPPAANQIVKA